MDGRKRKKNRKFIVPVLLLALVCVGAVELTACRMYAPALYARVTAPVAASMERVSTWAGNAFRSAAARVGEALTREEALPESQLASEPTVQAPDLPADPVITALELRKGAERLTGGSLDIVYYDQSGEEWSDQPYGTDRIGGYGCGPTAMAMAVSSMTDTLVTPVEMARWSVDNGCWAPGCGSYLSIVERAAAAYGLTAAAFSGRTPHDLRLELGTGHILVALMGPGHFTRSGHFILLRGITLSGNILVADPNSLDRSLTVWDPQLILDELSRSTSNGAPLWSLSAAKTP